MSNDVIAKGDSLGLPAVWLLMGHKLGDNAQVQALAEALGWPYEKKRFVYRPTELISNRLLGRTLAGIVKDKSSPLDPPWPDLVISAGRRNEPMARWIQKQADRRVRLVHLGRPWAPLACFDLIITTPQYRLPARPNVLHNTAPLHRVTAERLVEAAAEWAPRLAQLPRPYTAVLVGGHSGVFIFDPATAEQLGRAATAMAQAAGGSVLVTTSARTPPESSETLEAAIDVPAYFYRWTPEAAANPYFGYLALADTFIVTADSMSMLTEACVTGKPVYIFDPEEFLPDSLAREAGTASPRRQRGQLRFQRVVQWLSLRIGPSRMRRDIRAIHRQLIAEGRAVWLGQDFPKRPPPPPLADVPRAVERVRALFDSQS